MRRRVTGLLVMAIVGIAIVGRGIHRRKSRLAVERAAGGLHAIVDEIRFEQTPLERALAELSGRTGLRLAPRWDLLRQAGIDPQTPLTLDIPRGTSGAALGELLDCAGQGRARLEFFIDEGGAVAITTGADYGRRAFVSRTYDINPLVPAGGDTREARDVIVDMVRRLIDPRPTTGAAPHEVSVEVVAGRLAVVADRETQWRIEPFLRGRNAAQVKTMARLAGFHLAGSRSWSNQPLADVLQQLSREAGVDIAPDWPALRRGWIDPDVPITARTRNIIVGKLLNVLLDASLLRRQEAVGWTVDARGTVIVTTKRQIDRGEYAVRVYDLYPITRGWPADTWKRRELTRSVVLLFQNTVAPESWLSRGGEAWVRVDGPRFYIRQTGENHRQITALIDQLFKARRLARFRGPEPVPDNADFLPAPQPAETR